MGAVQLTGRCYRVVGARRWGGGFGCGGSDCIRIVVVRIVEEILKVEHRSYSISIRCIPRVLNYSSSFEADHTTSMRDEAPMGR